MVIQLMVGANVDTVLNVLREVATDAYNARGAGGTPAARVDTYLKWANRTALRLRNQVTAAEIDRLVLTPVYFALVALTREPTAHIGELVDRELDDRVSQLEGAQRELQALVKRWPAAVFAVADTSLYMHHPEKIEDLDFRPILGIREEPVHLLVPMPVVDELDRLKRTRDGQSRWRAAYTLAVLERCVPRPGQAARLQDEDFSALNTGGIPRGAVTVEIVLDPPRHTRLPIEDDEIIDRAVALHVLAARPLTFITYDTGQAMRARATPLTVKKLDMPGPSGG